VTNYQRPKGEKVEKKKDLLEKGALVQRDGQTYAIVPHIPGGLCTPEMLRKIADVSDKYNAAAIKLTSAARVAIVGLQEEDLDNVWKDLEMSPGAAVGLCVRSIKFCPGTTFCKLGKQDAVGLGMKLDELYHGTKMPSKFKIGVSGCRNACAESWIKDLGLVGEKKGWKVLAGGKAASQPAIGSLIADGLDTDETLALIGRIVERYQQHPKAVRLGVVIEEVGLEQFKKDVGAA
jgi:NAD(P)H-nitrite reductase large subunit